MKYYKEVDPGGGRMWEENGRIRARGDCKKYMMYEKRILFQ